MGAQSPMGEDAHLRVVRDEHSKLLTAVLHDGHKATVVIARAVSTDPMDEDRFRWLVSSAVGFHPQLAANAARGA